MSEQRYQGTLASGGTFVVDGQGLRILDPAGNQLAHFGREVISGINRDGQIVTVERHNDTIVTLTAASITDAVGLEQFVRDTIVAPPAPAAPAPPPPAPTPAPPPPAPAPPSSVQPPPADAPTPPLAFDAIDANVPAGEPPAPPPPAPRPPIISRPDDGDGEPARSPHDLPAPVPTTPPAPVDRPAPAPPPPVIASEPIPVAPLPPSQPPPASYTPSAAPAPAAPPPAAVVAEEKKGRRLWLWGCLGCGGLIVLAIICVAVLLASGEVDWDELTGDDETPTPFIIIATSADAEPSATDASGAAGDPTPTADTGSAAPTQAPAGDLLNPGQSGTLAGMNLTFVGSRTADTGLIPPSEGNEYLILNFRIENTTADPVVVSTLLQFELSDQSETEFSVALFADVSQSLDAEVPAGETLDGEVAFEVPAGGGTYTIAYSDFFAENPLRWAVN